MSKQHSPLDMSVWRGRVDDAAEGVDAVRWHQRVQALQAQQQQPGLALLGFACDAGVRRNGGRPGAAEGPRAIRAALAGSAWHQGGAVYDAGDVTCDGDALEEAQERLAGRVEGLLRAGHRPLVLGGGHESAWGTFRGVASMRAGGPGRPSHLPHLGILNLDAHFDLRVSARAHSGTGFSQAAEWCRGVPFRYLCLGISEANNTAALFARAKMLGAQWRLDARMSERFLPEILAEVEGFVRSVDALHLSLDLDVLPASKMPAVSAPAGMGVAPEVIEEILRVVCGSGRVAAAEVAEFSPALDEGGRGARLAARLVWTMARHWK